MSFGMPSIGANTEPYAQVKSCIAPGAHNFRATYPPAGNFGPVMVVCSRCGMTRSEARA